MWLTDLRVTIQFPILSYPFETIIYTVDTNLPTHEWNSILIRRQSWGMVRRPMRDNTIYLSRFMEIRFGSLVSIQWSVVSIRSSVAPVPYVSFRCHLHHVCELTPKKYLRVTGRSFKYGRIGGDHDKEGQKRVTNQNFVVMQITVSTRSPPFPLCSRIPSL